MYDLSGGSAAAISGRVRCKGRILAPRKACYKRWLAKPDDEISNAMLLLVQAQKPFESVAFDANRKQVQALQRTFEEIESRHARALVFYSVEEPLQFDQIMPRGNADAVRSGLLAWLKSFRSDRVRIVGADYTIPAAHYLDYMHLDDGGYVIVGGQPAGSTGVTHRDVAWISGDAKPKLP